MRHAYLYLLYMSGINLLCSDKYTKARDKRVSRTSVWAYNTRRNSSSHRSCPEDFRTTHFRCQVQSKGWQTQRMRRSKCREGGGNSTDRFETSQGHSTRCGSSKKPRLSRGDATRTLESQCPPLIPSLGLFMGVRVNEGCLWSFQRASWLHHTQC
jgi:hypothetical protein